MAEALHQPKDDGERVTTMADSENDIRAVLEELRGALQADGGDLEVVSIDGTKVLLRLQGACGCCPHAQMTLKNGIERILRERVNPEIVVERAQD
jgi:Fe-S cluster biogenesis protein NfuA